MDKNGRMLASWGKQVRAVMCLTAALFLFAGSPGNASADEARIAVASNFHASLKTIAAAFERQTGHHITIIAASTGKLYAQIHHGAPFAAFLAADAERPRLLQQQGLAMPDSRFTYAIGRLALWSPASEHNDDQCRQALNDAKLRHLAIANPKTAPYGAAARQALQALGEWEALQSRLVRGENISQTFRFVMSANAEAGFVALSQITSHDGAQSTGCRWIVPQTLHAPLEQQAVLLKSARNNPAAQAFITFLQGQQARAIITDHGYLLP
ncbi:MAG: molybdate ABC transporter substrate-binding protein [Mariprofundaceae bacterium]